MTHWYVGQEIVCINDGPNKDGTTPIFVRKYLKKGRKYRIRAIVPYRYRLLGNGIGFHLEGIVTTAKEHYDDEMPNENFDDYFDDDDFYPFWEGRFAPIEKLETKVSEFDKINLLLTNPIDPDKNTPREIEEEQFRRKTRELEPV